MKNINSRDWYYFWWTTRETIIIITSCINYFIPMTTFALVHRQTTPGRANNSTATPVTKDKDDKNIMDVQRKRRSQKNHASYAINGGYQKTRYTSQIGLIYLKPIVRYSTSVYFHSKSDFYEEPRSPKDNRYDSSCFRVNERYEYISFFFLQLRPFAS